MTATCPCCRKKVDSGKIRQTATRLPFDGFAMPVAPKMTYADAFLATAAQLSGHLQWACDDCIKSGKAILANPGKQFYTFRYPWDTAFPFLAYFDYERRCEDCRQNFTFSKEEQQHWYEQLQFVVYSRPDRCGPCRKAVREERDLNTELSGLLRNGKPDNADDLERIAEIYGWMGKTEKQKAFARAAEKERKKRSS